MAARREWSCLATWHTKVCPVKNSAERLVSINLSHSLLGKSSTGTLPITPALFTNKISPHQLGLADVLSALRFTGEFPKKLTLVGVIPESLEPHIGLTPTVEAMIEPALEQVLAALRESGVEAIPREAIHD